MRQRTVIFLIFAACFVLLGVALSPAAMGLFATTSAKAQVSMPSTSYYISTDVLSTGGKGKNSTSYEMNDTIGQPSAIGMSQSSSYRLYAGYWPTARWVYRIYLPIVIKSGAPVLEIGTWARQRWVRRLR